jgi:hypothetical protein
MGTPLANNNFSFPEGKRKALVMSYDDGSEHDRRLLELFNHYGIRGSFYLNSGKLGAPHQVSAGEAHTLYQGHEVACHTVNHPDLTQLSDTAIRREVLEDKAVLEDLTGYSVQGLAYPFGYYDNRVINLLSTLGIRYARTARSNYNFTIPQQLLTWDTSCHHNDALELGQQFLAYEGQELGLFSVWGHSYELDGFLSADPSKNWTYMESFCRVLGGHESIYYTTTLDIIDYLNALSNKLQWSSSGVKNTSNRTLWLNWQGAVRGLKPSASLNLPGLNP